MSQSVQLQVLKDSTYMELNVGLSDNLVIDCIIMCGLTISESPVNIISYNTMYTSVYRLL